MSLHKNVRSNLEKIITSNNNDEVILHESLRLLAKWRSTLIHNTLIKESGSVVTGGPFKNVKLSDSAAEGCFAPKLLGTYEQPLHKYITKFTKYNKIINIGAAEGYYAVGLAKLFPEAHIFAYDSNPEAQKKCREVASLNAVHERITIGSVFSFSELDNFNDNNILIICDIEGEEYNLFKTLNETHLNMFDCLVECHDCFKEGISDKIANILKKTHNIEIIKDSGERIVQKKPKWFNNLAHLDQQLATWEWRSGPTPWIFANRIKLNN